MKIIVEYLLVVGFMSGISYVSGRLGLGKDYKKYDFDGLFWRYKYPART